MINFFYYELLHGLESNSRRWIVKSNVYIEKTLHAQSSLLIIQFRPQLLLQGPPQSRKLNCQTQGQTSSNESNTQLVDN